MQSFEQEKNAPQRTSASVCATALLAALLGAWMGQESIEEYWQEHYGRPSPLAALHEVPAWRAGGTLYAAAAQRAEAALGQAGGGVLPALASVSAVSIAEAEAEPVFLDTPDALSVTAATASASHATDIQPTLLLAQADMENTAAAAVGTAATAPASGAVALAPGDIVFFAGDSMMEGIAPHVALWLKKHGIASINRSRFSTGLAYPNAKTRDWPQEIETTLAANPRIRLLAMFIGANDQLNIASDERRGHWLRFGSPEWEQAYRSRIARIMAAAQRSGTAVIWLGLPLMRQSSYDSKMQYITAITASEVQANGGTFLPTSRMLAPDGAYTDSVDIDGHVTAVRTKDGVHFTRAGQHLIAQALQAHINISASKNGSTP